MKFTFVFDSIFRPIPFQMVVAISILTMIASIVLAHNLEFSLGTSKSPTNTLISLGCMATLLLCSIFANGDAAFLTPYVTVEVKIHANSFHCLKTQSTLTFCY